MNRRYVASDSDVVVARAARPLRSFVASGSRLTRDAAPVSRGTDAMASSGVPGHDLAPKR